MRPRQLSRDEALDFLAVIAPETAKGCSINWVVYKDAIGHAASRVIDENSYGTALPMHVALDAMFDACEFARANGFKYEPKESK